MSSTLKIRSLMIIDDNPTDQMIYERIVARSGLVDEFQSFLYADEALEILKNATQMPQMILLDINMPRMNGFEFLEAASESLGPNFSAVVVMLTTSLDPSDERRAKSYPAVRRFLNKPLTKALLEELAKLE